MLDANTPLAASGWIRLIRGGLVLAVCCVAGACGGDSDAPDDPTPARGGDRLGWDQLANSVADARAYAYRLYVDNVLANLTDVRCSDSPRSGAFDCSGRLPPLAPGRHVLELAAVLNGFEGPRSAPFTIVTSGLTSEIVPPGGSVRAEARSATCIVLEGTCYEVRLVADRLGVVSQVTALPDGRVLFIEGGERVRVIEHGALVPEPALAVATNDASQLVSLAVDPDFDRTRTLFVAWGEEPTPGTFLINVTRYRELHNVLGQGAQIVTGLPSRADAMVPLAVDGDGLLYVAQPQTATDRGSQSPFGGLVLRFDRDGMTPTGSVSPTMAIGFADPTALSIDRPGGRLLLGGKTSGRTLLATLPLARQEGQWPSPAVSESAAAPERRTALAFSGAADSLSVLFGNESGVVLTVNGDDPLLEGVSLVSLGQGTPTAGARMANGNWYFAVQTDAGTKILELRRLR
jgi:hypothetical protein